MSYILDALRRADAERQRGAVPGLNAHPAPLPQADASARGRSVPLVWIVAGGVLLLAIAVTAWLTGRSGAPAAAPSAAAPTAAAAPASVPIAAATPTAVAPPAAAPSVATALPPATTTLAVPPTSSSTTVTVTVTGPIAAPAAPPARGAEPRSAAGARQAAPTAAAAAASRASASAPTAATRVPPLAELPEAVRKQLPPLTLGGGMYSEQAAQRLVLVNGQVAHEGDEPAAGLRVVQIRPRSVVFSFRGQLFEQGL